MEFSRRRPSPETIDWVAEQLGASVVAWRRLTGGLEAAVHRLTVEDHHGRRSVVLRQHESTDAAPSIEREAAALDALRGSGIPVPELLASDATGQASGGVPTLLMTRVPGRMDLTPGDPERWIAQIADVAARIHALDIDLPEFERWFDVDEFRAPPSAIDRGLWSTAIELLRETPPPVEWTFIHRDLQHFNLLWSRGRLTGVIDWVLATNGPVEVDIGHCELNLAVLFGADWAARFRAAYVSSSGRTIDPWWELQAAASFGSSWPETIPIQVAGRRPVDLEGMTSRVETLVRTTLDRC